MSQYGTPDFWRPPSPGGDVIAGSIGYPNTVVTVFPTDVHSYSSLLIDLVPTGTIIGYGITVFFYADQAATKLITQYSFHTRLGARIEDVVPVMGPWVKVVVTPVSTTTGATFNFFLIGYGQGFSHVRPYSDGTMLSYNGTIGAGLTNTLWTSVIRSGPAHFMFNTDATAYFVQLSGWSENDGPWHFILRGSNPAIPQSMAQTVTLGSFIYQLYFENHDAVTRGFYFGLIGG